MPHIKWYMLCSLLIILPFAQAEKCEDSFPAPQPSTVSYNARDIASRNRNQMSFEEAKTFIQNQAFKTVREFQKWSKSDQRPENFPANPYDIYKDQWTSWGDFLSTGAIAHKNKEWMNFEDARIFIQTQGIQTYTEFQKWSKSGRRPKNFPSNPNLVYKDQWTDWYNFLGTKKIANRNWMHFEDAKTFIQNQGIRTSTEFHKWSSSGRRPENFPSMPNRIYKDQWTGWRDFLGTRNTANRKKEWMSYQEARTFIQNQGIQTLKEFQKWSSSDQRPKNFPSNPHIIYQDQWTGWGNFLGTKNISRRNRNWMPFKDAKTFIQTQGIRTLIEFKKWSSSGQRLKNFPSTPHIIYKDQWTGWGNFLGTRNTANRKKEWMSFEDARTFIQTQGIRTSTEFQKWSASDQRPENFPSHPHRTYKDQWTSWGDFLGTENISNKSREFMSFKDAKTFIQTQGIRTSKEFHKWSSSGQRPKKFSANPNNIYKDQWTTWGDFLGTGNIVNQNRELMSFKDAKTFIQNQGIQNSIEFRKWSASDQRPKNFPSTPHTTYKDQWTNWKDFLGTRNTAKEWMHFEDAKIFIQNQGIQTSTEFQQWSSSGQRPQNFPSNPNLVYKDQWTDWYNFLGTKKIANRNWMNFENAKTFIQKQGIQTSTEFRKWIQSDQRPKNFPSHPDITYKDQWTSWQNFLGTGTIAHKNKEWISYQEARTSMQNLGITSKIKFQQWSSSGKRPKNFPSHPDRTYKDQWTGWKDFLGTRNTAKEWMHFEDAKTFIQNQGIQNSTEFRKWSASDQRPKNFPSTPHTTYADQWTDWKDFLGTKDTRSTRGTRGISNRKRMSYQETKSFIQKQGVQTRTKRMSYQEAVSFIQKQDIRTHTEFLKWSKSGRRPENFPSNPHIVYKDQWTSWGEFLGNKNLPIQMQYLEAKEYVQSLGIDNPKDFIEWLRSNDRPENFPPQPHLFYSEWINSKDFLSAPEKTKYMSYQEAKAFISYLGITTARGFFEMMKFERDIFPENFPPNPQTVYKNSGEWTGWNDFLDPIDKDQSTINEPIESQELEESFIPAMDLEESFIGEIDL